MFSYLPNPSAIRNHLLPSQSNTWDVGSSTNFVRNVYAAGDFVYCATSNYLRANTSPGSDNANLFITASGGANSARGPYIGMYGKEHASAGIFDIVSANLATGHINCTLSNSSSLWKFLNGGGNELLNIDANGNINGNGTNGGDLVFNRIGKGLKIKEGANGRMGTAVLVAGTVTVSNTSVTANTRIQITRTTLGGTVGNLSYTISAGASFTINSSNVLDTSTVTWLLIEPA